jgi:hypothetical protein
MPDRVQLMDTLEDVFVKLSESNAGALRVLLDLWEQGAQIDPDLGPLLAILYFDTFRIYGSRIWTLYRDVCKGRLDHTLALLRAVQLGLLPKIVLHHAIDTRGEGLDVPEVCRRVKERLPNFTFQEE